MKTYERIIIEDTKEIPTSVTCNKCGKSQELTGDEWDRQMKLCKYQSVYISFGYGSKFDMDQWNFEICEECLVEMVRNFKHLPEGYDKEYADKIYKLK